MDFLKRMNMIIEYIESNICSDIDLGTVSEIACCHITHFQRMFSYVTGITLNEYIRKRKHSLAAQELVRTNTSVTEIALKYGYESPDSFSRAFQRIHGLKPSSLRSSCTELGLYPKLSFSFSLKGAEYLKYRIETKNSFKLIGKGIKVNNENAAYETDQLWRRFMNDGTLGKLHQLTDTDRSFGVIHNYNDDGSFSYHIASCLSNDIKVNDFETIEIPGLTWAVFENKGPQPETISKLYKRAYTEWFPGSGYESIGEPELEVYHEDKCELWLPIIT